MTAAVHLRDGFGRKTLACVTPIGQVVVSPYSYDEVANANMVSSATAYSLFKPKAGKQFVITTILINALKSVTTDELVDIYEATSTSSTTIVKSIMQVELLDSTTRDFVGLNLLITEGAFLNAKADDSTTLMTIMGYYIPKL